jgi:hypothetical protein
MPNLSSRKAHDYRSDAQLPDFVGPIVPLVQLPFTRLGEGGVTPELVGIIGSVGWQPA